MEICLKQVNCKITMYKSGQKYKRFFIVFVISSNCYFFTTTYPNPQPKGIKNPCCQKANWNRCYHVDEGQPVDLSEGDIVVGSGGISYRCKCYPALQDSKITISSMCTCGLLCRILAYHHRVSLVVERSALVSLIKVAILWRKFINNDTQCIQTEQPLRFCFQHRHASSHVWRLRKFTAVSSYIHSATSYGIVWSYSQWHWTSWVQPIH